MTSAGRFAVIGGGAWGSALANAAALAGRDVTLWMREPARAEAAAAQRRTRHLPAVALHDRVTPTADASRLADSAAILVVVPAQAVREVLSGLAPFLPDDVPLVVCSKGIERTTGLFMSDVARAARPAGAVAILSGPGFAADVARGLPTALTVAAPDGELARRLAAALSGPTLRVYHSRDIRGVEIGGAAKNVLAIAAGIVEGSGLGESAKAALVARGFAELMRFAGAQGGRRETLMGLSGLGDLVLTCGSAQSRNFALGLALGRGVPARDAAGGKLAEGAYTAGILVALADRAEVEMPISRAVAAVLAGRTRVGEAVEALMSRPLRSEG